ACPTEIGTRVTTLLDAVLTPEHLEEFSHFRRKLPFSVRPLEPIAAYPDQPRTVSRASLLDWRNSNAYEAAERAFADYPERSLCRPIDRMLLYHLVRTLKPE